tara:strand:- start:284 stop:658 length:375 start_codon:yes stop_codon:yes gene_type:complete
MESEQRKLLFIVGCVPARILLAFCPLILNEYLLLSVSVILAIIGFSFLTLFYFDLRLSATEGGGQTWWNKLRQTHGILYVAAGLAIASGKRVATSCILFLDLVIGVVSWLRQHDIIISFGLVND